MSYYLYILRSQKDNHLYVGITGDIRRRIKEHNSGMSRSTKGRCPFRIVHTEIFNSRQGAARKEWFLKNTPEGGILKKKLAGMK